jgi:uncharacterized protein YchJ
MNKLDRRKAKQIIKDALKSVKANRLAKVTINKPYATIQRNETCPCESGLKYKKCCLKRINDKEQEVYEDIHARKRASSELSRMVNKLQKEVEEDKPKKSLIIIP